VTERTDDSRFKGPVSAALKTKYQSVFDVAKAQGVQLTDVHQEGSMLMLQGTAPSMEAANTVWYEIKRINPKLDDIVANFAVVPSAMPSATTDYSTETQHRDVTPVETSLAHTYTVQKGDTL